MAKLHTLKALVKDRKRVGRGGKLGGTAGKGHKGQKARSGGFIRIGFEGGQMPLFRRTPKRGFNNAQFQEEVCIVNLTDLERVFAAGNVVTKENLIQKGLIKPKQGSAVNRVKVLGNGTLTKKLTIEADAFSKKALEEIQKCGGEARLTKEM